MKRRVYFTLMVLFLVMGCGVLVYPTASDYINTYHYEGEASQYVEDVQDIRTGDYKAQIKVAEEYNQWLAQFSSIDAAIAASDGDEDNTYEKVLSLDQDGVMGVIYIPDKNIYLPIYHGTQESELQKGAGHYKGSSLPIGGAGTHAVITGHTGLTSAKMFTEIDTLKERDVFYLYVLGDTLKYQVDKISVVKPEEVNQLSIEEGKDYVTLVTCTPYGVNSHRLLVRGSRIPYADDLNLEEKNSDQDRKKKIFSVVFLLVVFFLGGGLGFLCGNAGRRLRKKIEKKG